MPIVPKCRQVRPAKRKRSRSSSPAVSSSSSVTDDDVAIMSDSSAAGPVEASEAFDNLDVSNEIEISGSDSIMDVLCYDADDDETMDVAPSSSDCLPEHIVREVVSPDHSYFSLKPIIAGPSRQLKKLPSSTNKSAKSSCVSPIPLPPEFSEPSVPQDMSLLLQDASIKISMFLYQSWICHVSDGGIHVMLLSKKFEKAVQRRLFFLPDGSVQLSVHCEPLPVEEYLREAPQAVSLAKETVGEFVDRCVDIINKVRNEEMCAGLSDEEYKDVWQGIAGAVIDKNPYQENRYTETLRSSKCPKLISIRKWRCGECEKLRRNVHRRQEAFRKEANKFTPNAALSDSQKSEKLVRQQKTVLATNRRLDRLQKKMQQLLEVEGVQVDKEMSDELTDLCKSADLSEVRSLFLQQQLKASKAKSPSSIRWHPTMIRFALGIYLDSPGVYEKMRESGVLALPSSRLLFDYSHVDPAEEGVYDYVLEDINKKLEGMHDYQKYHSLLCDEMHICQNLVYRKSTGEMIGFVKLEKNQVFADIAAMEKYLATGSQKVQPEMASKMLSFMVKGVASNVKEVVASYPVNKLTSQMLYAKTWEVINRCERSGIRIIAFVSDGFAVNRSFLKKHTPARQTKSGIIYATVNKCAPHRLLFFMSDVAHLIKTIRNSLSNSREGKKSKRCLQKGGEKLLWQTIINLYNAKRNRTLRKSYKLTAQHIYIDSYSAMKVKFASQVLSKTVAQELEDMKWPGTKQLVDFIRRVNDWFDCLNGAHSTQGIRTRNPNLNPYTDENDPRFEKLKGFLQYLSDWKEEVYSVQALGNASQSFGGDGEDLSVDFITEEERTDNEATEVTEDTPAAKKLLANYTLDGIEFTTMAFIDAVKFLISEKVKFVNARVFSQDHLEQHFSKQRSKGSGNPNLGRSLQNDMNIHTVRELGFTRRGKGNTEERSRGLEITTEPLPKRKCPAKKK